MHDGEIARAALEFYGVADAELTSISVSENATFRLDHHVQGRSVLRVHRAGYQDESAIRSELAWIAALRADGVVDTPAWLPTVDGEPLARLTTPHGVRHVVRFAWVDGAEPAGARLAGDFERLGEIAARLHLHARTWRRPTGFTRPVWNYETSLGRLGHWGRWQDGLGVGAAERVLLDRADAEVARRLTDYGTGPDRFALVHADMRLANLIVDGDRVVVIDFDDCGFGWLMYDFAAAVSFMEHEPCVGELADAWLSGYRTVAEPAPADVAELATLVMLRRLLLVAWIGSHPEADAARELGAGYTMGACDLAERYLGGLAFG